VYLGALQKFMGLRASWNRGSGGQRHKSAESYGSAYQFHRILHPAGPAEDSAVHGFRLVSRGVALALHARLALRERAGPDAEVPFATIISWNCIRPDPKIVPHVPKMQSPMNAANNSVGML